MEKRDLFSMLTSTIWQDWKSHIRTEKECAFNEIFYSWTKLFEDSNGPLGCILLLFMIVFAIPWWFLGPIIASANRASISRSANDIELSPNDYKLIRNSQGRIGVCYWHNWYNCELLLPAMFDNIEHFASESFVITVNGKHGLYNARNKKMHIKPIFERYKIDGNFVVFSTENSKVKYNCYGERVLI